MLGHQWIPTRATIVAIDTHWGGNTEGSAPGTPPPGMSAGQVSEQRIAAEQEAIMRDLRRAADQQ